MAVEAVHADVEFAVGEPADAEILGVEADVADAAGRRHPFQALSDAAPERIRVADGLGVVALIVGRLEVGLCGEGLGNGIDIGHGGSSSGRSEARGVGKECVSTCRSRGWACTSKRNKKSKHKDKRT